MKKFITSDIGKKQTTVYIPETKNHHTISTDQFLELNIPEMNGHDIVIEDAHVRSQEDDSLAQSWTIEQLRKLRLTANSIGTEIFCFPQKVTPKARKVASIGLRGELLDKTDNNDVESIAFYLHEFPEAYDALKVFNPIEYETFQKKVSHIYTDRDVLTLDSNEARNNNYGINTDYEDAIVAWLKKRSLKLATLLPDDVREFAGLEWNSKKNGLKCDPQKYNNDKFKFLYGVVNTILRPNGELRLRSDKGEVPFWKYAKKVYFGITPYHMRAGVTASNYKYHKRKAGSVCKKSMSLESKKAIQCIEDVHEIREARNNADKKLRTLWRTIREMIVEDGLR